MYGINIHSLTNLIIMILMSTANSQRYFKQQSETNLLPYITSTDTRNRLSCASSCLLHSGVCGAYDYEGTTCTLYQGQCPDTYGIQSVNSSKMVMTIVNHLLTKMPLKMLAADQTWALFQTDEPMKICQIIINPSKSMIALEETVYFYKGCYREGYQRGLAYERILTEHRDNMTIETCINGCTDNGYGIAGLKLLYQCFCYHDLGTHVPSDERECFTRCSGNSEQICGGFGRLSIWQIVSIKATVSADQSYETWTSCTSPTIHQDSKELRLNCGHVAHSINITTLTTSGVQINNSDITISGWTLN